MAVSYEVDEEWPIKNIETPHDNDVLYGRGGTSAIHATPVLKSMFFCLVECCFSHDRAVRSPVRAVDDAPNTQAAPTTTWATGGFAN
jgi:hypothetical protein